MEKKLNCIKINCEHWNECVFGHKRWFEIISSLVRLIGLDGMAVAECASLTTLPAALCESAARPQALVGLASLLRGDAVWGQSGHPQQLSSSAEVWHGLSLLIFLVRMGTCNVGSLKLLISFPGMVFFPSPLFFLFFC